jgi:AraC family transcriptional regulator of adaptative response/methylated-DNA-[protein]-cysteine methyltransferase
MTSYARIERILRWLGENAVARPSLAEMAALAGLGESHFHHEFVRWTGVTPKDFVQCLTLADARERLVRGSTVTDAAEEVGLSGSGRLHDLCVSLEAATPGEIRGGGAGMTVRWGEGGSPFGLCRIGETARGICLLEFLGEDSADPAGSFRRFPRACWTRDDPWAEERIGAIFAGAAPGSGGVPLRAWVRGSEFQVKVWRALLEIPPGALATYGQLADSVGKSGAARAVGTAVGANPVAFLIPCHRVIRETGAISGYRWGVGRKRALLAWEKALGNG